MLDIMKTLAEIYLQQEGIEAIVETIPINETDNNTENGLDTKKE